MRKILLILGLFYAILYANTTQETLKETKKKEPFDTHLGLHDKSKWGASVKKKMHETRENTIKCGAAKCGVPSTSSKCGAVKIPTH